MNLPLGSSMHRSILSASVQMPNAAGEIKCSGRHAGRQSSSQSGAVFDQVDGERANRQTVDRSSKSETPQMAIESVNIEPASSIFDLLTICSVGLSEEEIDSTEIGISG